jgi:hypothetical protein
MKCAPFVCTTVMPLLTAIASIPQLIRQVWPAQTTSYEVVNLGTLGGTQSAAYGINNEGRVNGAALAALLPSAHAATTQ